MQGKRNRIWKIALTVLVLLIAVRLSLPYAVTRYINYTLSKLNGYTGTIDDVDIHLTKGAYQIENLKIFKNENNTGVPFVKIPLTDLSIEWNAILNGSVVGEIRFIKPVVNFIAARKEESTTDTLIIEQSGKEVDWIKQIKRLMPIKINRVSVDQGEVTFSDFSTTPNVALFLHHVQLDATNLDNVKDNPEDLPSRIYFQALSVGNGQLNVAMKINVLKEVPDLDMDLRFEHVNLKALNDLFKAYGKVDVEKGDFNLYAEIAVLNGLISGYVKPLFNQIEVANWKSNEAEPSVLVWENMVDFLTKTFKNQKRDQYATRVAMEGQIAEGDTPFLPVLWHAFSNAFVKAFQADDVPTVSIASAAGPILNTPKVTKEKKTKKEIRKERRKEKREQRRLKKELKEKEENAKADKKDTKDNS